MSHKLHASAHQTGRECLPSMYVTVDDEGWHAMVPWIDIDTGHSGQLVVGPETTVMEAVEGLGQLVQDIQWPWLAWPHKHATPCVWLPVEAESVVDDVSVWSRDRGWTVALFSADDVAM